MRQTLRLRLIYFTWRRPAPKLENIRFLTLRFDFWFWLILCQLITVYSTMEHNQKMIAMIVKTFYWWLLFTRVTSAVAMEIKYIWFVLPNNHYTENIWFLPERIFNDITWYFISIAPYCIADWHHFYRMLHVQNSFILCWTCQNYGNNLTVLGSIFS